ncbi:MAG: hypothetical protein ACYS0E_13860 [Planctomycetota bacterium]|jgi:hypothetical protein
MSPSNANRPRPGILKVFWPAFLGWGAMVVGLVFVGSGWVWNDVEVPGAICLATVKWVVFLSLVGAVGACFFVREARNPLVLFVNLSTLLYLLFTPVRANILLW